jgi:hypothetical protein
LPCVCAREGGGRATALCLNSILHICVSGSVAFAPAARESRRSQRGLVLFCFSATSLLRNDVVTLLLLLPRVAGTKGGGEGTNQRVFLSLSRSLLLRVPSSGASSSRLWWFSSSPCRHPSLSLAVSVSLSLGLYRLSALQGKGIVATAQALSVSV